MKLVSSSHNVFFPDCDINNCVLKRKLCFVPSSVEEPVLLNPPPPAMSLSYFSASLQCCSTTLLIRRGEFDSVGVPVVM